MGWLGGDDGLQQMLLHEYRCGALLQLLALARGGTDYWRALCRAGLQRRVGPAQRGFSDGWEASAVVPRAVRVAGLADDCYGLPQGAGSGAGSCAGPCAR